ncbi:MAG: DeoR family transcriptional regulator [Thermoplasmata archaeon]
MARSSERKALYKLATIAEKILNLPKTASKILKTLVRSRKKLNVNQVVKRVDRSERSVRKHLVFLTRKGILERKAIKTARGKLAYIYYMAPVEKISAVLRREISRTTRKLDEIARPLKAGNQRV